MRRTPIQGILSNGQNFPCVRADFAFFSKFFGGEQLQKDNRKSDFKWKIPPGGKKYLVGLLST